MGNFYAWADPVYIAEKMTEPQLWAYAAHVQRIKEQDAKRLALEIVAMVGKALSPKQK